jgi:hypothetical protein
MYLHPINPTNDEMKINPGKTNASIIRPNASRSSYLASSKKKIKKIKNKKTLKCHAMQKDSVKMTYVGPGLTDCLRPATGVWGFIEISTEEVYV